MAKGINKFLGIGNLGKDPDVRQSNNGNTITGFSIAISDSYKDKQTGQMVDRTEWVNCVCFNRLAEIAADYLHKGSKIYIEGQMRTRKWQDQTGNDRYTTEIVVNELQMLDGKSDSSNQQFGNDQAFVTTPGQKPGQLPPFNHNQFDEEIPF